MPDRIAVIGSNSFSGSHFTDHALRRGIPVLGASRSAEPDPVFLPSHWDDAPRADYQFAALDLNHDLDRLVAAYEDFEPDCIVNFAAQGMVAESWIHPDHWYQTNVLANVRLHDRLRKLPFLKKYVHVSTPEVYGTCAGLIGEDAPFNPSTPYAASRAACELHLRTFIRNYGFPAVFTRAANVFGPGQQLYRIIPRTILFAKMGRRLPLHGGGHSIRSFIHIRDVAEGTLRVAAEAVPGQAYHLSTSRNISIRAVVELTCDLMGARFSDVVEIAGDRPGKDAAYLLDNAKARNDLDWSPAVELEDGIRETIAWVDRHLDVLSRSELNYVHKA